MTVAIVAGILIVGWVLIGWVLPTPKTPDMRHRHRNDTAANWTKHNPVLADGELVLEMDTHRVKVGDGVRAYRDLEYWV